jgi:4-hydroxybenzoate polyprenyltransferase/phosphoserine phosphatase
MPYSKRGQFLLRDQGATTSDVLVVDLDGTLVRSDLMLEVFWSALSKSWKAPFFAAYGRLEGRPAMYRRLSGLGNLEVASLPYNEEVIGYLRRWRAAGGRTALVTAYDQSLADDVAAHLGIFDEVHGSSETRPLQGDGKVTFLKQRFGERGFAYIGSATSDLPIWEMAARSVTVDGSSALRARVDALGPGAHHLFTQSPSSLQKYSKALRTHQWLKNCLVFVPMLAAHQLTLETFRQSLLAFIAFSLVASSVYIINDLLDLAADRAHPRKRNRPFASGQIPLAQGMRLAPLLLLGGLAVALPLGGGFVLVMLLYFAATVFYSLYGKRQPVIDICTLAGLYAMRLIAGGVATGIPLSVWLLAFAIFFFFALAAVKRQAELVATIASGALTAQGRGYQAGDLPLVATMATASGYVSVLVLALYVNSPDVLVLYGSPSALWGICFIVLYWISRIVMVTHRGNMHDDPLVYAVKDLNSWICLFLIVAFGVAGTVI